MGEAKRRGTFEERQKAAMERDILKEAEQPIALPSPRRMTYAEIMLAMLMADLKAGMSTRGIYTLPHIPTYPRRSK